MELDDVRAVLLSDGWHSIERGSLRAMRWPGSSGDGDTAVGFVDLSRRRPHQLVVATRHVLAYDLGAANGAYVPAHAEPIAESLAGPGR